MNNERLKYPSIKSVITTEWGAFLAVFGSPIMVLIVTVIVVINALLDSAVLLNQSDLLLILLVIPLSSMVWWPAVLWWYLRIRKVYEKNLSAKGEITSIDKSFMVNIGVEYKYYIGKSEEEGLLSLVNRKRVRDVLEVGNITIAYDPEKKVSFIKEIFE